MVELLLAISLMSIVATALATLASAVQVSTEFTQGLSDTCQHARVSIDRIQRTVSEAHATLTNPGVKVLSTTVGSVNFPETLIVWHPEGERLMPNGPPLVSELVIFCPDPNNPARLVEIRAPNDHREVEMSLLDSASGKAMIAGIKTANTSEVVELTPLLRVVRANDSSLGTTVGMGVVRFATEMHPSEAEWTNYSVGSIQWDDLHWAQSLYGPNFGMRQVSLRFEMQLLPPDAPARAAWSVPFFGSASVIYEISR